MHLDRRVRKLEKRLSVTPTAQELETRALAEELRRKRCERTNVPYEPIHWAERSTRVRLSIADILRAGRRRLSNHS